MVPTEETAVEIAVAVFKPIYGADKITSQQPFQASLKSGVWHVSGSLPPGFRGGTAEAEIAQRDGRILRVWHGR
ncbi:NTF2 fold immunity protein [Burkholderiaceae bacterium UC74_6]